MSFYEHDYREIITKAVCGTGRQVCKTTDTIMPHHRPASILGCWIINHRYHAKRGKANEVEVHGSYDVNIWYAFDDNTKTEVVTEKVDYCDHIALSSQDVHCLNNHDDIIVKVVQQPNCLQCKIDQEDNKEAIEVEVEKEFIVKVIGETKVNVKVERPQPAKGTNHYSGNHQGGRVQSIKASREGKLGS